jgi:hypothetical protein
MRVRRMRVATDQRSTRPEAKDPGLIAASERSAEHPHRCRAGHRWEHTGPTAEGCPIARSPSDPDLSDTSPQDCPLCSGREDLLLRPSHAHHCVVCDGDWEHEGRCLEGFFACCPWCFPEPGAGPAAGMRSGAHQHYCPECSRTWEHGRPCGAPLRAVLPECPACRDRQPVTHGETVLRREPRARRASRSRRRSGRVLGAGIVLGSGLLLALIVFKPLPLFPRHGSQVSAPTSSDTPKVIPQPSSASPPADPNPGVTNRAGGAGEPEPKEIPTHEPPADHAAEPASSPSSASTRLPAEGSPPATSEFRTAAETPGPTEPRPTPESRRVDEPPRPSAARAATPGARREVTRPVGPSVPGGLAEDRCPMPSGPSLAVSAESGQVLGLLVGTSWLAGHCSYVVRRPGGSLWGLAADRVRIQPLPGPQPSTAERSMPQPSAPDRMIRPAGPRAPSAEPDTPVQPKAVPVPPRVVERPSPPPPVPAVRATAPPPVRPHPPRPVGAADAGPAQAATPAGSGERDVEPDPATIIDWLLRSR